MGFDFRMCRDIVSFPDLGSSGQESNHRLGRLFYQK